MGRDDGRVVGCKLGELFGEWDEEEIDSLGCVGGADYGGTMVWVVVWLSGKLFARLDSRVETGVVGFRFSNRIG